MSDDINREQTRLVELLARRAEREARFVVVGNRLVSYGKPSFEEIRSAIARYHGEKADMLRARPFSGEAPTKLLDVVVLSDFGRGEVKPQVRGAAKRLADLVRIARVLCGLGDGLRLGELIAATGMGEQRLWYMLQWAKRQHVLRDVDGCWYADHAHRRITRSIDE